jgi:hypothetical protein
MSERNIPVFFADVIKDDTGAVYPTGCTQSISCGVEYIGQERVATALSQNSCQITEKIGDIVPLAGSATPNVLTVKVKDSIRGFIWIDKASYDARFGDCNDCCVALPTLATPASFTASNGDTQSIINWDDVPNATGYILEMATDGSFTGATIIYTGSTSGFTKTGLTNGTTYYFRVHATADGYNDSGLAFTTATPAP